MPVGVEDDSSLFAILSPRHATWCMVPGKAGRSEIETTDQSSWELWRTLHDDQRTSSPATTCRILNSAESSR